MGEPTVGGLTPQQLSELTQALTAQQAESSRLSRLQLPVMVHKLTVLEGGYGSYRSHIMIMIIQTLSRFS